MRVENAPQKAQVMRPTSANQRMLWILFFVAAMIVVQLAPIADQIWTPSEPEGVAAPTSELHFREFRWLPGYMVDPPSMRIIAYDGPEAHPVIYWRLWLGEGVLLLGLFCAWRWSVTHQRSRSAA